MNDTANTFDVLVVGAGPGGIAAAVTCAAAGRRVALIDDNPFAGGQIWRNRGGPAKDRQAAKWFERLEASDVTRLRRSRVVARPKPDTLLVDTPDGPRLLRWSSIILATGARELFLPFPGWTLPGVVGAGGIQALVKQGLPVEGKRIVVAGSGPLLLAVADLMRGSGAIVPIILEQTPGAAVNKFALSLLATPSKLVAGVGIRRRLLGTPYATDSFVTRADAAGDGLRVEYNRRGRTATADCDYLACGYNLIANNELPQVMDCEVDEEGFVRVDDRMRTTVPNVFAIGEVTGVGGVDKALLEGEIAGHAAVGNDARAAALAKPHAAAVAFSKRLDKAFALRPEVTKLAKPDTVVCRCEDVTLGTVEKAFSGRDAKLQSRCGMGPCQGRICGPALQRILGVEPPQVRPPVFVTSIGTLAGAVKQESPTA